MKLKHVLLLLILLKAFPSFSMQADTLKLYYNLNDFKLSSDDQVKISSLKDSANNKALVKIFGYGDNTGSKAYNLILSVNRANGAKAYLLSLNKTMKISAKGIGQIHSPGEDPKTGYALNRRVEIIFSKPIVVIKQPAPAPPVAVAPPAPAPAPVAAPAPAPAPVVAPPAPAPAPAAAPADTTTEDALSKINNLSTLDVGGSISLPELTFKPGRHVLESESVPYMDALLATMKKHPTLNIEIQGFICCDYRKKDGFDSDTRKYELSLNRAKTVYDYLVTNGIDANRMKFNGLGNTKPKVYPEKTDKDREANRRVELVILSK